MDNNDYLSKIENMEHRNKLIEILDWIALEFPMLEFRMAWNQPMYTHHDTFIIGCSVSKKHIAVSPEIKGIQMFVDDIEEAGYTYGTNIFRIKWQDKVDYTLLHRIITFNIKDKSDCKTFWRK